MNTHKIQYPLCLKLKLFGSEIEVGGHGFPGPNRGYAPAYMGEVPLHKNFLLLSLTAIFSLLLQLFILALTSHVML